LEKSNTGEHDSRKARHGVNEKQTLAVLTIPTRSAWKSMVSLYKLFLRVDIMDCVVGGKILTTEIGFNNWLSMVKCRELERRCCRHFRNGLGVGKRIKSRSGFS
jgi:hypothetical protein